MTAVRLARPEERHSYWTLWFAAGAAPVLWSLHLLLAYWISSEGCGWGGGVVKAVVLGLTAAVALVIVVGMLVGARLWHEPHEGSEPVEAERSGRNAFMGEAGVMLGALFLVGLVLAVLPILILVACR